MQGQFTQRSPAPHLRGRAPGGHLEDKAFCGQLAAQAPQSWSRLDTLLLGPRICQAGCQPGSSSWGLISLCRTAHSGPSMWVAFSKWGLTPASVANLVYEAVISPRGWKKSPPLPSPALLSSINSSRREMICTRSSGQRPHWTVRRWDFSLIIRPFEKPTST